MTPEEAAKELEFMRMMSKVEEAERNLATARCAEEGTAHCYYGMRGNERTEIASLSATSTLTPLGKAIQALVIQHWTDRLAALRAERQRLRDIVASAPPRSAKA